MADPFGERIVLDGGQRVWKTTRDGMNISGNFRDIAINETREWREDGVQVANEVFRVERWNTSLVAVRIVLLPIGDIDAGVDEVVGIIKNGGDGPC